MIKLSEDTIKEENKSLKITYTIGISADMKDFTLWQIKEKNKKIAEISFYKSKSNNMILLNMKGGTGRYFDTFQSAISYLTEIQKSGYTAIGTVDNVEILYIYK